MGDSDEPPLSAPIADRPSSQPAGQPNGQPKHEEPIIEEEEEEEEEQQQKEEEQKEEEEAPIEENAEEIEHSDDNLSFGSLREVNAVDYETDSSDSMSGIHKLTALRTDTLFAQLPVPPDGGYGWVIVAAAFFNNLVVDGFCNAFGPFISAFEKEFQVSKALTSFIGSLLIGACLLGGPFAGGLLNRYNARVVVMAGSLLSTVSLLLSTLSPNIYVHLILYGLFCGIGFAMVYLPGIIIVSSYFEGKRALATGIAVAGSGFGTFLVPVSCKYFIQTYNWKVSLYFVSALTASCALAGSLFTPLGSTEEDKLHLADRFREFLRKFGKVGKEPEKASKENLDAENGDTHQRASLRQSAQSTEAPLLHEDSALHASQSTFPESDHDGTISPTTTRPTPLTPITEHRPLSKSRTGSQYHGGPSDRFHGSMRTRKHTLTSMNSEFTTMADVRHSRANLTNLSRINVRSFANSVNRIGQTQGESMMSVALSVSSHPFHQSFQSVDPKEFSRPFSRRDIFLQGSIRNLREFEAEGGDFRSYRESQVSIPAAVIAQSLSRATSRADIADVTSRLGGSRYSRIGGLDNEELLPLPDSGKCSWIPHPIRNAIAEMIDWKLLAKPMMTLLCLSNVLGMFGFYVPLVFIIDLAKNRGVSESEGTALLSVMGISNTMGRIFFGWVADRRWFSALNISNASAIICGLLTMFCFFMNTYALLIVYAVLFGFIIAAYVSLTSVVLTDLLGVEHLTNSFGLVIVSRGVASLVGTPLAGVVYEMSRSYDAAFVCSGFMFVSSGMVGLLVGVFHHREGSTYTKSGNFGMGRDPDAQSGKLSVLTERSEENLTEYQRTIQSLHAQNELINELEQLRATPKEEDEEGEEYDARFTKNVGSIELKRTIPPASS